MHILLVDDDPIFLRLMERQLPRAGHTLVTTDSAESALAVLEKTLPDIVLVDLGLPGVVGASFVESLGRVAPTVPFAVITGLQDVERSVEMMHRGALDYLLKDSSLQARLPSALARIEEHLRRAKSLKASEMALKESEGRRRVLMEAARDGIVEFDPDGKITFANPAAHQLLDVPLPELIGQDGHRYFPQLEKSLLSSSTAPAPSSHVTNAHGETLAADASFIVAHLEDRVYHSAIVRDITERLLLEQEILNISDQERMSYGRELHDGLGQQMAALHLMSNMLVRRLQKMDSELAAEAARIADGISEAIQESRAMAHGLAPLGVSEQGLVTALSNLARKLEQTYDLECHFTHDEGLDITAPDIALHLFRMAQEACSNAIRHGKARTITISLTKLASAFGLSIIDDGCGFSEIAVNASDGLGLRTIRHRAQVIGGQLDIKSKPLEGTQIHCRLPNTSKLNPATVP